MRNIDRPIPILIKSPPLHHTYMLKWKEQLLAGALENALRRFNEIRKVEPLGSRMPGLTQERFPLQYKKLAKNKNGGEQKENNDTKEKNLKTRNKEYNRKRVAGPAGKNKKAAGR